MKAIETFYDGHRFRSRLEARWACFFKTLGIAYEYEKEGFDLDGVWYLPDFWLPSLQYWVEIKGQYPSNSEIEKTIRLHELSRMSTFILYGQIPNLEGLNRLDTSMFLGENTIQCAEEIEELKNFGGIGCEQWEYIEVPFYMWSYCHYCNSFNLRSYHFGGGWCCESYLGAKIDNPRLIAAYTAARSARFEHGEKG